MSKYCPECGTPKSAQKDQIYIRFLLDRSGSMAVIADATIEGFNSFITAQKATGVPTTVTLTQFDQPAPTYTNMAYRIERGTVLEKIWDNLDVNDLKPITKDQFVPRGNTPLYDAIGREINEVAALNPKGRILFVIQTDGEENCSKEFNRQQVFDLITQKKKEGWEFVFLGANQDAYGVGASLGISKGSTLCYTATMGGTQHMNTMRNSATVAYASGNTTPGNFFGDSEDKAAPGSNLTIKQ